MRKSWFNNLKIKWKIGGGFALVIFMITFSGIYTYLNFDKVKLSQKEILSSINSFSESYKIREKSTEALVLAEKWLTPVVDEGAALSQYILYFINDDYDNMQALQARFGSLNKSISSIGSEISSRVNSDKTKEQIQVIQKKQKIVFDKAVDVIMAIDGEGEYNKAIASTKAEFEIEIKILADEIHILQKQINEEALSQKELQHNSLSIVREMVSNSLSLTSSSIFLMTSVIIIVICLAIVMAFFTIRSITVPMRKVVKMIRVLSQGELDARLEMDRSDEIGELAVALDNFAAFLKSEIVQLSKNAKVISFSSEELSAVSGQLANGSKDMVEQSGNVTKATEEVSSNVQNMATSVEEMSINIQSISINSEQTSTNMNSVSDSVKKMDDSINNISRIAKNAVDVSGTAAIMSNNANKTMKNLSVAAQEIGKVTGVIKRIAEQTNLLSLNATIEAASAGEAGKGFAIVAREVKELAGKSSKEAENIARRIKGVQTNTLEAVNVIDQVSKITATIGESISKIMEAVDGQAKSADEITLNIREAASGSNEMASSIAEVSKVAGDMAEIASNTAKDTNNAAKNIKKVNIKANESDTYTQEVHTQAEQLSKIATKLEEMVRKFKFNQN